MPCPMRRLRRHAELLRPGDFFWTHVDPDHTRYIIYLCPNGQHCGVPILPGRLPNGAGWAWNGNLNKPTLTPSINCVGGCRWHGFITAGVMT